MNRIRGPARFGVLVVMVLVSALVTLVAFGVWATCQTDETVLINGQAAADADRGVVVIAVMENLNLAIQTDGRITLANTAIENCALRATATAGDAIKLYMATVVAYANASYGIEEDVDIGNRCGRLMAA